MNKPKLLVISLVCLCMLQAAPGRATSDETPTLSDETPMLPDWQVLEFEEKAFWATAKSRLEIVPDPDNKKLWQLSVLSSVVNNSEQITVTFDPDSGRVYTRDRLSQGKGQRLKSYQYHDDVILRERRIPGSEPGVTAQKWPVTSREKVTLPPSAADYVVTSPYLLLLLAQQLQTQDKDKSLTVLVHTDWNFYRVHLTHGNGVPLKVNYTVDGRDVVSAERETHAVALQVTPEVMLDENNDFNLLGLQGDIILYLDRESGLPLQLRGVAPRIGAASINLKSASMRDSGQ